MECKDCRDYSIKKYAIEIGYDFLSCEKCNDPIVFSTREEAGDFIRENQDFFKKIDYRIIPTFD